MAENYNDIFGQDISLIIDDKRLARVAASGELILANGLESAVQDIILRLLTRVGGLFYDADFGSYLPDFIHDENTKENRLSLKAEVMRRVEMDARVKNGSVSVEIISWDEKKIKISISWIFWETEEPQNISLTMNRQVAEAAISDLKVEYE